MNNQKHIHVNIYFEHKVDSLRNELINLGTFNYNIKALGRNLTENFAVFASYEGNRIYINGKRINTAAENVGLKPEAPESKVTLPCKMP